MVVIKMIKKKMMSIIFLILISILSCAVFAASDWKQWMRSQFQTGYTDSTYSFGLLRGDIDSINYSILGYGSSYQPLIADIDQDGKNEIIGSSGNYIYIWEKLLSGELSTKGSTSMGASQNSQGWIGDLDGNNDNGLEYVVSFGNKTYTVRFKNNIFNKTIYGDYKANAGLNCIRETDSSYISSPVCILMNSTDNWTRFYYPLNGTIDPVWASPGYKKSINAASQSPLIGDLDGNGEDEFLYPCDKNTDGNEGICVGDFVTASSFFFINSDNFGSPSDADAQIKGIALSSLTGGVNNIIVTYDQNVDGGGLNGFSYLKILNTDGSSWGTTHLGGVTAGGSNQRDRISPPIVCPIRGSSENDICTFNRRGEDALSDQNTQSNLKCWKLNDAKNDVELFASNNDTTYGLYNYDLGGSIACSDVNGDGYKEILAPIAEYYWNYPYNNKSLVAVYYPVPGISGAVKIAIGDIDENNFLDIVGMESGNIFIVYSNASNSPPVLNNSLLYGGYTGWYTSPICLNTVISFQAQQIGSNANYYNDVDTDQERLVTNCGNLSDEKLNGSYSHISPFIQCYYNSTGTYAVTICIQDTQNDAIESSTNCNTQQIPITVIDGISGVTCNVPAAYVGSITVPTVIPDSLVPTTPTVVESFLDTIFGGLSNRIKLIIGFIIILVIIILTAKIAKNAVISVSAGMLGAVLSMLLGLIPIYFVLLICCLFLIIMLIGKYLSTGSDE